MMKYPKVSEAMCEFEIVRITDVKGDAGVILHFLSQGAVTFAASAPIIRTSLTPANSSDRLWLIAVGAQLSACKFSQKLNG